MRELFGFELNVVESVLVSGGTSVQEVGGKL